MLLVAAGCAAVPWPPLEEKFLGPRSGPAGLLDLRGVIHVHTRGSHDSPGTVEAVIRAATQAGVSWVALTEHTRPGALPRYGRIGAVTVVPGLELRAAKGSILALGVRERPPRLREPADLVRWVHAAGGLAFVGHFEKSRLADPEVYASLGLDGIELVNLHAAARARPVGLTLRLLFLPGSVAFRSLLETPRHNLARWSALPAARTIVGGVDAHAKYRLLGPIGGNVDRYRDLFRMLTTHVLARDPEIPSILEALRAGRSYVALEGLGSVDAFRFEPLGAGYRIEAPRVARLALVCDGSEVASQHAERADLVPPPAARLCRAEAWLGERLWIVTSYRDVPAARARSAPAPERQRLAPAEG